MSHTHAPGWRGRPQSMGKVEDAEWIEPRWLSLLWLTGTWGCAIGAVVILAAAFATWFVGTTA